MRCARLFDSFSSVSSSGAASVPEECPFAFTLWTKSVGLETYGTMRVGGGLVLRSVSSRIPLLPRLALRYRSEISKRLRSSNRRPRSTLLSCRARGSFASLERTRNVGYADGASSPRVRLPIFCLFAFFLPTCHLSLLLLLLLPSLLPLPFFSTSRSLAPFLSDMRRRIHFYRCQGFAFSRVDSPFPSTTCHIPLAGMREHSTRHECRCVRWAE